MSSVNKAIIVGHLGGDPEVRYTSQGNAVTRFNVATNEVWVNKNGEKGERTEWHRIAVWGKQGEVCKEYLKKGRLVYVEGRLQTREWTDKDGNKRYTTEIIGTSVRFLGKMQDASSTSTNAAIEETNNVAEPNEPTDTDSDVPF